jgi:hypothetical protein
MSVTSIIKTTRVTEAELEAILADVGPDGLALWWAYSWRCGRNGYTWAANSTIAGGIGMSLSNLKRYRARLVQHGIIRVVEQERQAGKSQAPSHVYLLRDLPFVSDTKDQVLLDEGSVQNEPGSVQNEPGSVQNGPVNLRKVNLRKANLQKQQQGVARVCAERAPSPAAAVVVTSASLSEDGELLEGAALELADDLAAACSRWKGIARKVMAGLVKDHGEAAVRAAIAVLEEQYGASPSKVGNPGGWLRSALRDGYESAKRKAEAERQAREAAIAAAAPPAGVKRARRRSDGLEVEILRATAMGAYYEGDMIPAQEWAAWDWICEPASPAPATVAIAAQVPDPSVAARSRVAAYVRMGNVAKARALALELGVDYAAIAGEVRGA